MKLSWIIVSGPEKLADQACQRLEMIADTYLSVNTPVQNAVAGWLSRREEFQGPVKQRTLDNLRFLEQAVKTTQCQFRKPEGGWYAVIRIPLTKISEEELILQLLEQDQVFVHPGYFFDFEEEGFLVLSLLPPLDVLKEGIKRIFQRITRERLDLYLYPQLPEPWKGQLGQAGPPSEQWIVLPPAPISCQWMLQPLGLMALHTLTSAPSICRQR